MARVLRWKTKRAPAEASAMYLKRHFLREASGARIVAWPRQTHLEGTLEMGLILFGAALVLGVLSMPYTAANALTKRQQYCLSQYNRCIEDVACKSEDDIRSAACYRRCSNKQVRCNKAERAQ